MGSAGIGNNQAESKWTCNVPGILFANSMDIRFWNDQYEGALWNGNPVEATKKGKDQMFRNMEAKYEHADFVVSDGENKRTIGYQTTHYEGLFGGKSGLFGGGNTSD